jgi:hypothetical protein
MNSNNILNVANINLSTINGSAYPPTVTTPTLSSVLTTGNSAGTSNINMNSNSIINANEIDILKTTTGIGNPAIEITTNATGPSASNLVVNRFSTAPTANDDLFAINVNGRDSVGSSVEYTRISTHTIDPSSGIQTARLSFFARGGTLPMSNYEVMILKNSLIELNRPTRCFSGFQQAHKTITLTANTNFSTAWSEWIGSHMYINQTTNGWTMTLGLATNFQGSISWIKNVSPFILTLSVASGNFGGNFGNGTGTITIVPHQTLMLVANGSVWEVVKVIGVPYMMRYFTNTNQTIPNNVGGGTLVIMPTLDTNNITTATGIDTWGGARLTYYPTAGTNPQYSFANNTAFTMTIMVEAEVMFTANTAGVRALWINQGSGVALPSGGRYLYTPNNMQGTTAGFPGGPGYAKASGTYVLAPNDFLTVLAFQNSGATGGLALTSGTANARANIQFTRIG